MVMITTLYSIPLIKKEGSQSAISDFIEYPILYPDGFAEYTGFPNMEKLIQCHKAPGLLKSKGSPRLSLSENVFSFIIIVLFIC